LLEYWRGNWDSVLPHIRSAAEIETFPAYTGWEQGALILYEALLGDSAEALQLYEGIEGELPQSGKPNTTGSWHLLAYGIEALDALGERERAGSLYPLAQELIATGTLYLFNYRLVEATAGIAAASGQLWQEAERHFEAALRLTNELPAKIEQPEVRRFYSRMLLERDGPGDRDKAKRLLAEAIDAYKAIGMPKHIEMAEELLGSL
jgi:tetratricopeptide (TPR) repeat protein